MKKYRGKALLVACVVVGLLLKIPHSSNAITIPQIMSVESTTPDGSYKAGTTIMISVKFNGAVTVEGVPSIALNSGGTANYASGSGTDTLVFNYAPQSGENSTDLDWSNGNALTLNDGTITDSSNASPANLSTVLPALGAVKDLVIDTVAPEKPVITLSETGPTHEVTVSISYPSDTVDERYQMWGDNPAIYNGPFVLTSNRTISAYAVDTAGNSSETVVGIINIDTTPPSVQAKIKGSVQATYSNVVKLEMTGQSTDVRDMQFSDDNENWSEWESFNSFKPYTLPSGAGMKTIYVRVRDAAGNLSEAYPVSITLLASNEEINLALYSSMTGYPQVTASYTCCGHGEDDGQRTVNGLFDYSDGAHDRWTNYGGNASDSVIYDLGESKILNQIKLYLFNDGGGVKLPSSYNVQYWMNNQWIDLPNQVKAPLTPTGTSNKDGATKVNTLNTVNFNLISTNQIKITMNNGSASTGFVELEMFLNSTTADTQAAAPVVVAIDNLPNRDAVKLSDSEAIQAARAAFEALTETQKALVTRLDHLVQAETALHEQEAMLTDLSVESAFSNGAGNEVTIKVASPLDINYTLETNLFHIRADDEEMIVTEAYFDYSDWSYRTIKLMLSSPIQRNATAVSVDIQRGALWTTLFKLNNAILDRQIITFKSVDVIVDDQITIEDIAAIASRPEWHIDVNRDGVFNSDDVKSLLSQIHRVAD
ncbi:discoidin domain-containing protein [Paenibacillus qinlingensis]|uniref:discoidin domain-containing protein n=1 Tax=Paenibacillus qinlingensis TaxID=1837343 RepID=UPI0015665F71|nr:discoidin domain-containing protein [Paenibacillus qinlingensis]NQX61723.1 discoidin domain-containing protein [Paenibacillus qinlingensis]